MVDLSLDFKRVIDTHGYGFQYALLKKCERLGRSGKSPWSFEAAEIPVTVGTRETHIDFVLRTDTAVLVAECKRANPALARWCFARAPYVARRASTKDVRLDQFSREPTTGRSRTRPLELCGVSDQYQLGFEMRSGRPGDEGGKGRGAIDDAVAQVLRATSGFINAIAANPGVMDSLEMIVLPVVFTTAELLCSDADLSASELATGETPPAALQPRNWIWFQQNISPSMEHSQQKIYGDYPLSSIAQVLRFRHARSIAIVSTTGIENFLCSVEKDFEDFQIAPMTAM